MVKTRQLNNKRCSTCLKIGKDCKPFEKTILVSNNRLKTYGELLEEVTKIEIKYSISQKWPQTICEQCSHRLKDAYEFIQQVLQVHQELYSMENDELVNTQHEESCIKAKKSKLHSIECSQGTTNEDKPLEVSCLDIKVEDTELVPLIEYVECLEETRVNNLVHNMEIENSNQDQCDFNMSKEMDTVTDTYFPIPTLEIKKELNLSNNNENDDDDGNESNNAVYDLETLKRYYRFACYKCPKKYTQKQKLLEHQRKCHQSTSKNYKILDFLCSICGSSFNTSKLLSDHFQVHLKSEMSKPDSEHRHKCNKCPKRYTRRFNLLRHMKNFHSSTSPL